MPARQRFPICPVAELPPGTRRIVQIEGRSIGLFNVHGTFHALKNVCPHEGAELCRGLVTGLTVPGAVGEFRWEREGEILRCPWHGWEFEIATGTCVFAPESIRTQHFETSVERFQAGVEDDWVVIYL